MKKHGILNLKELTLYPYNNEPVDLKPALISLEIYENIDKSILEAKLVLFDHSGIMEFAPVIGGETIYLKFSTKSDEFETIDYKFKIIRISNETATEGGKTETKLILYNLISESGFNNYKLQISKSYKNQYIHQIVKDILNILKAKKINYIENTEKIIEYFVIPFSNPIKNIEYLKNIAYSSENYDINFKFFETLKGFNFVSLSHLLKQNSKLEFNEITKMEDKAYIGNMILNKILYNVFDLENDFNGGLGKTLYFFNREKKYFEKYNTNLINYVEKTYNLGNYIYYPKKILQDDIEKTYIKEIENKKYLENNLNNSLRETLINNYKIRMQINGNSDLHAGNIIEINYKSKDKDVKINKQLKRKYLITKIKHKLFQNDYYCVLECIKDAFYEHAMNLNESEQYFIKNKKNL